MANSTNNTTQNPAASNVCARRIVEKTLLVWVNSAAEKHDDDFRNTLEQLHKVIRHVVFFSQPDQCIHFIEGVPMEKTIVVISNSFMQDLLPRIHSMKQVDTIYIFGDAQTCNEHWAKEWSKIKGQHVSIISICEAIRKANRQYDQDSIPMSFLSKVANGSTLNINQLDPSFMYTRLFKNVIVQMQHNRQSVENFVTFCREKFQDDAGVLEQINEFEHNYSSSDPLYWYTRYCFIYEVLNRCLRLLEADIIVNMGFFIQDLHRQIDGLHQEQFGQYRGESFFLYRGQALSCRDFEKLQQVEGGLLSFNCFLSTSKAKDVSLLFAESVIQNNENIGILFIMTIDPNETSTPFANIANQSYFESEAEILFSTHAVFRIEKITNIDNNERLFEVHLKLTSDDDRELHLITNLFEEELKGGTGWERLGNLLIKVGNLDKAEELYLTLLDQAITQIDEASYYHHLGCIHAYKNNYLEAIQYYEKSLSIRERIFTTNHTDVAGSYNNIGTMYEKIGEYLNALTYHEKALSIWKKILHENHLDLTPYYNNVGAVYDSMKDYSRALQYYQKTLSIQEKTLLQNHPDLAITYNNIGFALNNMREYSRALQFYEKALSIWEKTLPRNHPDLATLYTNLSSVCQAMGNYEKALSFVEKSLCIDKKIIPQNNSNPIASYNHTGQYSQALSSIRQLLDVQEHSLSPDDPDLENMRECMEIMKLLEFN